MKAERWQRVKALFEATLGQPAADRAAFLAAAAGDDRALQAEVESLLAADTRAAGLTDRISPFPAALTWTTPAVRDLVGATLGPYRIEERIGAGGMGVVFRAFDTRLQRTVALKLLHEPLLDASARSLLLREARNASALNHPSICTIYDVGEVDDQPYIAMEFIEGRPLSEIVAEGAVPVDTALGYGRQIAEALAHAHDHGIIHRDLKSANIVVSRERRVKVLDFGVARRTRPPDIAETTRSAGAIDTALVGTLAYVAPEVLRGEPAGVAGDLWALGVVLYELLAGTPPFTGRTAFELTSAILKDEPADLADTYGTPPLVARVVRHCLAKHPAERFRSASDVAFALDAVSGVPAPTAHEPTPMPAPAKRWLGALAGLTLLAAVAAGAFWWGAVSNRGQTVSFMPLTHQPQTIFRALFAPDGKTIVFSAARRQTSVELFSLSGDYPEARSLGLRDTQLLSVSSRSELAVLTHARFIIHRLYVGTLARMPLGGGAPREILENVREADWGPDGESLAVIREVSGRDRLEYPIGKVLHDTAGYLSDLRVSPAGDRVAFFEHPIKFDDRGNVAVVDVTGKKTILAEGYSSLQGLAWTHDGREVLYSGGESYPQSKVYRAVPSGSVQRALESAGGLTLYDIAPDGRWLASRDDISYIMMGKAPDTSEEINLSWLDLSKPAKISPDGRTLLFTEESSAAGSRNSVCLRKTDGSPVVRLGEGTAFDLSPDGKWALAVIPGPRDQLVLYPTGAGEPRHLDSGAIEHYGVGGGWFADGRRILICGNEVGRAERCYVQDLGTGGRRVVTPEDTHLGLISPDGNFVLVQRGPRDAYDFELYSLAGGAPRRPKGLGENDRVIKWERDNRSVVVEHGLLPARIERVDLESGRRTLVRELPTMSIAGATAVRFLTIADDSDAYAYRLNQHLSQLFLIEGAR